MSCSFVIALKRLSDWRWVDERKANAQRQFSFCLKESADFILKRQLFFFFTLLKELEQEPDRQTGDWTAQLAKRNASLVS